MKSALQKTIGCYHFNERIDFSKPLNNIGSIKVLMKEFIRRMYLWSDAFMLNGVEVAKPCLFDVIKSYNNSLVVETETIYSELQSSGIESSRIDRLILSWCVNFELNKVVLGPDYYKLPDPYEPVLKAFERGIGGFGFETGILESFSGVKMAISNREKFQNTDPFVDPKDEKDLVRLDNLYFLDSSNVIFK